MPVLVSVLLPVRDAEEHLPEAIASLEAQTLGNGFEVVAVDDGSTDGTPDQLRAWADRDARVRVVTQPALGIVSALERARNEAHGRYLARMDADDVSLPTRLERQLDLLEADPDMVGCGTLVEYFPRERLRDGALRYERWINAAVDPDGIERSIFVECPLAHPTFFLRAEAVEAVGGYRDAGWAEDYDLVLRLWAAGGRFGKVPEVLLRWREGASRLSRTDPRYGSEAFLACKVHWLQRTLLQEGWRPGARPAGVGTAPRGVTRSVVIWGAGPVGKALSKGLRQAGVPLDAFVELDPRKIGQEIHGAPVLDTEAGLSRRGPLHLAAVGQKGARGNIAGLLEGVGMRPLRDFVALA